MKKIIFVMALVLLAGLASGLRNPAAVYCTALGYDYSTETTDNGQVGYCTLPSDLKADAWDFMRGQVALNYSYCAQEGYKAVRVEQSDVCGDCLVCVVDGKEVEVTELMELDFTETSCGDGTCGIPETSETCPEDCAPEVIGPEIPEIGEISPEGGSDTLTGIIIVILAIILFVSITLLARRFRKKAQP